MKKVKIPWNYWFLLLGISVSYCVLFSGGSPSVREWASAALGLMGTLTGLALAVMQDYMRDKAMKALEQSKRGNQESARQAAEYTARLDKEVRWREEYQKKLDALEQKIEDIAGEAEIQERLRRDGITTGQKASYPCGVDSLTMGEEETGEIRYNGYTAAEILAAIKGAYQERDRLKEQAEKMHRRKQELLEEKKQLLEEQNRLTAQLAQRKAELRKERSQAAGHDKCALDPQSSEHTQNQNYN